MRLGAGRYVMYWDGDPNGHVVLKGPVKVVRARGLGVLVEASDGRRFRLKRSDVEPQHGVG